MKVFALMIGCIGLLNAQTTYQLQDAEMSVAGTSTLHDWESSVNEVDVEAKFVMGNNTLAGIDQLEVTIPAKSITSTKGSLMDNKTWDALKADKHPNITYKLNRVKSIENTSSGVTLMLNGALTMAGVTQNIDLKVTGKMQPNGNIVFEGSKKLNMTNYKMKPPTALLGSIKTGEEVTVKFTVTMNTAKS